MSTDDRYDEATIDKVADEIRYFLLQEAATDRPWDFAEHIVAALADADLLIPPGSHRRTDLKDGYTHRRTVIFTPWTEVPDDPA